MKRINLWVLVFVVFGLVLAMCVSTRDGAEPPREIGMMVQLLHSDHATVTREFDMMSEMHVKWVRADFFWPVIEAEPGEFDWSYSDEIVKEATARRMSVVAVLSHTPEWARGPGTTNDNPPTDVADFAAFARVAVARYASQGVHIWEIWNEPNSSVFWKPRPDPDHYGELFRASAPAIRTLDPTATVLTGGLTPGTTEEDRSRISQLAFVEQLYANGAAQLADAIAVHPYTFPRLPADTGAPVVGGINEMPQLHQLMEHRGDGAKKVWITEFGAPTGNSRAAVSEDDQARTITQARKLVQGWTWAGPLIIYELRDGSTDPAVEGDNFGMVRRDYRLKPAGKTLIAQEVAP